MAIPRSPPLDGSAPVGKGGAPGTCRPLLEPVEAKHPAHHHAPVAGMGRALGSGKEEATEREGRVHTRRHGWRRGHAALLPRKSRLPGNELDMAWQGHPSHPRLLPACQSCCPVLRASQGGCQSPLAAWGPAGCTEACTCRPGAREGTVRKGRGMGSDRRGQVRDCHRAPLKPGESFRSGLLPCLLLPGAGGGRCAQERPRSSDSSVSVGH